MSGDQTRDGLRTVHIAKVDYQLLIVLYIYGETFRLPVKFLGVMLIRDK